jgi:hypothetical protein
MTKGAMPVPYIIALILGVIVVALLAYWFVTTGGRGFDVGKGAECTARVADWCVTQNSQSCSKAREVCGSSFPNNLVELVEFCKSIIKDPNSKFGTCAP